MSPHSPSSAQPQPQTGVVELACAHLDAAAQQLTTNATADPFTGTNALAGQVSLVRGGIHPGIRATPDPGDRVDALGHLDAALVLLDTVPHGDAPADLMLWTARLAQLRPAVQAAYSPNNSAPSGARRLP